MKTILRLQPLTRAAFADYGDVIDTDAPHFSINRGSIERFHDLARVDVDAAHGGCASISIAECHRATTLPHQIDYVERHPRGSQAFIPLTAARLIVVVARRGAAVAADSLRAFVTTHQQGINYHRGVWHLPLICEQPGQRFLLVDRSGGGHNCDEFHFDTPVVLVGDEG